MLFLKTLVEAQRCVASQNKWGSGLLGAQKRGTPDGVYFSRGSEIFGKRRCIAFSCGGQRKILATGQEIRRIGNAFRVADQEQSSHALTLHCELALWPLKDREIHSVDNNDFLY